jgi:hypothetical protein
MKPGSAATALLACALLCPSPATPARAADTPVERANDFTSEDYFDPPHELQIKSRLSGAEAQPVSPGVSRIKQMKLETFAPDGTPNYIVEAPECVFDENQGTASSPGHLTVRQANGQRQLQGDGFLWRQADGFLCISNRQRTDINLTPGMKLQP